jgi:hypothetical protein
MSPLLKLDTLNHKQKALLCLLIGSWIVFAVDFIYRTSHVSIDGIRYFTIFESGSVSLCVKNELAARVKSFARGSCPTIMLECR